MDTTAVNGNTYYYVVSGSNAAGESANSSEVIGTPKAAPTGVIAVGGVNQVQVSWDAFSGAASYTVRRSAINGGPYTTIASGIAGTSYLDTMVASGTTYYYVVIAQLTGGGDSGQSGQASAITAPVAPTATNASLFAATVIRVGWAFTDPVVTQFLVERSTDNVSFSPLVTVAGNQRSLTNAGLAASTTYFYRVQAQNATGLSGYSVVVSNTTPIGGFNVNFANALNGNPANDPAPTPSG